MSLVVAARIARREMRGGLQGFVVFLACLVLAIAAIAAIGGIRAGIERGLQREGAAILGGDAEIELTYRFATQAERDWLTATAVAVSEVVDFRSMVTVPSASGGGRALTQVKSVDDAYPLYGSVELEPDISLAEALDGQGDLPGLVMERALADRMQLGLGDRVRLGSQEFVLSALLLREPDAVAGTFSLGPRTIVRTSDLAQSGLLVPGTLFETAYRMKLDPGTDLDQVKRAAKTKIEGGAFEWTDRRDGAPGVSDFVTHLGTFLTLIGLAGLAVGGIGVSAAVRAYLEEKVATIATLKSLGADRRTIFRIYLMQVSVLALVAIFGGLSLGTLAPIALSPVIRAALPVPVDIGIYPDALLAGAVYGALAAALFAIWPIARAENIRAAALYRDARLGLSGWPRWRYVLVAALLFVALVGVAALFSGEWELTLWVAGGLSVATVTLAATAWAGRRLAAIGGRLRGLRRLTALRLALGSIGGPGNEAMSVVLSLGLGLSVLATIGQIDRNLRDAIARDLPEVAPLYFVVDIQQDQVAEYERMLASDPAVERTRTAPMLRGVITAINGRPAREVAGDHWVVRGDRGITYAARPPDGRAVVEGDWWPPDYTGAPLVSFAAEEAREIGLKLGDKLTLNILGRDIEATITSFRDVDFSNAAMGFVMTLNPSALAGAPHSYISTIYADKNAESRLLNTLGKRFPNITMISVRAAVEKVAAMLRSIAAALIYAALATLITGAVVLIGVAAAGERARAYEAALLKTLGAERRLVRASFLLRSAILGALAGLIAVVAGGVAAWAVMVFIMQAEYEFVPASALAIVGGGILVNTLAGAYFSRRALNARPAAILRARE